MGKEATVSSAAAEGLTLDIPRLLRDYGEHLVNRLRQSPPASMDALAGALRTLAAEYAAELDRAEDRGLRASGSEFNAWIGKLFAAVETGCSHIDLVDEFLQDLYGLIQAGKSDAMFGLIIEQVTDGRLPIGYRLGPHVGKIHDEHWHNFSQSIANLAGSRFLDALFAQEASLPLALMDWVTEYDGVFDSFARAVLALPHGTKLADRYWLTAVSLIAKADDEPRRIVFLAYRNIGSRLIPNPGKGAGLENRALDVLRIAYGQIDRQIANIAGEIAEKKEDLVKTLLPSIYAHDFMRPVGNVQDWTLVAHRHCRYLAKELLQRSGETALKTDALSTVKALTTVSREIADLHDYLHSYAGLELKTPDGWPLKDGTMMVQTLMRNRLRDEQVDLRIELPGRSLTMAGERSLFIVVLANLLHNAINIMALNATDAQRRAAQQRKILVRPVTEGARKGGQGDFVDIVVANTDTDIADENRERIFRKGYSTRGLAGGGRGLHLCRQICAYLGGSIALMNPEERRHRQLDAAYRVAFVVRLPLAKKKSPSPPHSNGGRHD